MSWQNIQHFYRLQYFYDIRLFLNDINYLCLHVILNHFKTVLGGEKYEAYFISDCSCIQSRSLFASLYREHFSTDIYRL